MIAYPLRAAANGPGRIHGYGIVDQRAFPLDHLGHHTEAVAEAIAEALNATRNDRLRELAALAAIYIRQHSPGEIVHYDGVDCDGTCLADDIVSAL